MSSRPSPWNPHRPALSRRDFLTRTGGYAESWAVLCQSIVGTPDFRFLD